MVGCSGKTLIESFHPKHYTPDIKQKPDTQMFLFTRLNPQRPEYLHKCGGRLPSNTDYNATANTEIFIHGGGDGICRSAWIRECKDELLKRGAYNVILIDWTWGNSDLFSVKKNSRIVAEQVAFLIQNIMYQTCTGPDKFHIIGHSLGAHVAGFVGKALGNIKIRRITGIDAAGILYYHSPPEDRLDKTDAHLVDVIHTSSGVCTDPPIFVISDERQYGHADFYVNGGKVQPEYVNLTITYLLKQNYLFGLAAIIPSGTYHQMAYEYYKLSINACDCQFVGIECQDGTKDKCPLECNGSNCAVMGMDWELHFKATNQVYQKKYYVQTTNTCPYCDNNWLKLNEFPDKGACSS